MLRALAALSSAETDTELSGALSQLSTVQEKMEKVHADQATADFYQLSEMVKDYVGLVGAVKDVFQVSDVVLFAKFTPYLSPRYN